MKPIVAELKIDSGNDYATATIRITRQYTPNRALVSDLPEDIRQALLDWLGAK